MILLKYRINKRGVGMKKIFSLGLVFILTIGLMIGCQKKYTIEGLDLNNIGKFEQEDLNKLKEVDDIYFHFLYESMHKLVNADNDTKIQLGINSKTVYTSGTEFEVKEAQEYTSEMITDMGRRELDKYIKIISKYYDALILYGNGELQKGDELLTEDVLQEYKAFHEFLVEYTE